MPVTVCQLEGSPGFRWGRAGKCFTYTVGNEPQRARARERAAAQGRAIAARGDAAARLFVQDYPQPIEDDYAARLLKRVTATEAFLDERLGPAIAKAADDIDEHAARGDGLAVVRRDQDTLAQITRRLLSVVNRTERAWSNAAPSGATFVRQLANAMDTGATDELAGAIERVHNIKVIQSPALNSELIDDWVATNVDFITTVDTRYFDDVRKVIREGLDKGISSRRLTKDLAQRAEVSKSRARLIVRDQLGTLNSQITQARQTELGIDSYTWRDSGDDRVRDTHQDFNGNVFTWATGSPEGHPGEPIACRCTADPNIPEPASLPGQVA